MAQLPNRGKEPDVKLSKRFPPASAAVAPRASAHFPRTLTLAHKHTFVVGLLVREVSVLARTRRKSEGKKSIIRMKTTIKKGKVRSSS